MTKSSFQDEREWLGCFAVQPVLTTIWGILAFGEHLRPLQAVGVALVLGGVLLARPARRPA